MWLFMIYHRPFKVLLKYWERPHFRHQGSDVEENGAETLPRPCAHTHTHAGLVLHKFHFILYSYREGPG